MILLKTVLFSVLVPGTVVLVIPRLLVTQRPLWDGLDFGSLRYAGLVPLLAGFILYYASARDFVVRGKGTPAPIDPPTELVVSGPYRMVRNPMYLSGVLILGGEVLLYSSLFLLLYLCVIWLVFHLFVVFYEEPHLREIFGAAYEDYCRSVSRWLPSRPGPAKAEDAHRSSR